MKGSRSSNPHVWYCEFDAGPSVTEAFAVVLSPSETRQAKTYRHESDRHRFIQRRGILRHLLAFYTGRSPERIAYERGGNDRPCIRDAIDFNLSSTERGVLIAISKTGPVGVDIEAIRPLPYMDELARNAFTDSERGRLMAEKAGPRRLRIFFRLWTAKEACLKASGLGVAGLKHTRVSGYPPRMSGRTRTPDREWTFDLHSLDPERDVVATVAGRFPAPPTLYRVTATEILQNDPHEAPQSSRAIMMGVS